MFKKKDKDLDITSLNEVINTGKRFMNIAYFMALVAVILLGTYLIKEWQILDFIKEFLVVISPIFIGFVIAWLFAPLVEKLENKKVPRILSTIIVYLLFLGGLFLVVYAFVPTLINQIKDFIDTIPGILSELKDLTNGLFSTLGSTGDTLKEQVYGTIESLGVGLTKNLPDTIFNLGKGLVSGGMTFILGLMIGFYMLFDFDKIGDFIEENIPKRWKNGYKDLSGRLNTSLRSYLQGLFLIMLLVFITQSIGLTLAGLEAPLIFALFCAITDIIPYFGPYIGAIPAIIVGFTISPITGVFVIISILVVQLLENNFYQPLIMGHTMKLHPVTIMIGLLIFQHFFGILGMVIATPVIACLKVFTGFINEKLDIFNFEKDKDDEDDKNEKKLLKLKQLFK